MIPKYHVNKVNVVGFQNGFKENGAVVDIFAVRVTHPGSENDPPDAILFMSQAMLKDFIRVASDVLARQAIGLGLPSQTN